VFIEEQRCVPENLEWDDVDSGCIHALARRSATVRPIGCGRAAAPMATSAAWPFSRRGAGGAWAIRCSSR
jgi:hypothetical protein